MNTWLPSAYPRDFIPGSLLLDTWSTLGVYIPFLIWAAAVSFAYHYNLDYSIGLDNISINFTATPTWPTNSLEQSTAYNLRVNPCGFYLNLSSLLSDTLALVYTLIWISVFLI